MMLHCVPEIFTYRKLIMSINYRATVFFIILILTMQMSKSTLAQSVTIGGTPSDTPELEFMSMFTGDLFANFRHMERFAPVSTMTPGPIPWQINSEITEIKFKGKFLGQEISLEEFIETSDTSSFLILKNGNIVFEEYRHGDSKDTVHVSFSIAKSFVSTLVGIALEEKLIDDLSDPIKKYLPELTSDTFDDVTIKHVLQMSSGVRFDETYTDPNSDINKMGVLVMQMSYLEYINTLKRKNQPGTYNHYASINTQLLGILLARVTGLSLTDYMVKKLWHPLGMEHPGYWVLDEQGHELAMGGMSASARDYAKLGLLFLNKGKRGETQIVSPEWVKKATTPTEIHLLPGDNIKSSNTAGYQFQWWTPRKWDGDFLARGIWGQTIYINPKNQVVIVKLAADQKNFDPTIKLAYIDYLQELGQSLVN